ncbi:MAG TPA: peptidase M28, partial [Algoriphagus sp.]|nr:peptidase M28 [Algoriphagus sp.]
MRKTLFFLSILAALVSCSENQPYQFTVSDIETHIDTLSSDYFLGRMPFTEGEEKTVAYLVNEFQKL